MSDADRRAKSIHEFLDQMEQDRGSTFSPEVRARLDEMARDSPFAAMLDGFEARTIEERQRILKGLTGIVLMGEREHFPTPDVITAEILKRTPELELPDLIYDYVCHVLKKSGAYLKGGDEKAVLLGLPRAQRMVYTMYGLDGEIYNGGFGQFFGNSTRELVQETLDDCRLIGAELHARCLEAAVPLFLRSEAEARAAAGDPGKEAAADRRYWSEIAPAFDALTDKYYALEKSEPLTDLIIRYLRQHPDECLTS